MSRLKNESLQATTQATPSQTHGFFERFKSVRFQLKLNVFLVILSFSLLGYKGITGMQDAGDSISDLYSQGMQHSIRAGKILNALEGARSALLLGFQHDPSSEFATMHNHPASQHVEDSQAMLARLHDVVDNEILASDLAPKEHELVQQLATSLDKVTSAGFNPAIAALSQGDYTQSNHILLTQINPMLSEITRQAQAFLNLQINEGELSYETFQDNMALYILLVVLFSSISMLVIVFSATLIIRRVNQSVVQLEQTADDIASGDLTQRIALGGDDEFAHIANYVNRIAARFQQVVQNAHGSTAQLASAAEENSVVVTQTQRSVVEQQQQTQQVAAAIHEFTATVREVAANASEAAHVSAAANDAAHHGQTVVNESMAVIQTLATELEGASQAMTLLSQHSNEIGSVIEVIQAISEQTNLLALNAAIEAARAGEQGRGFAVVADEVRSLARRTQDSTEEIQKMIQRLQQGAKDSMVMMERGTEQVKLSVDKSHLVGNALQQIMQSIEQINGLNAQIATASEEQSAVTEEININITSINDIAEQTAAGAEQSNAATQELAKLAESMAQEIAYYKV